MVTTNFRFRMHSRLSARSDQWLPLERERHEAEPDNQDEQLLLGLLEVRRCALAASDLSYMMLGGYGANFSKILAQKDPARAERLMEDSLGMFRLAADSPKAGITQWNEYANALNECPFPRLHNKDAALVYAKRAADASQNDDPAALDTLAWPTITLAIERGPWKPSATPSAWPPQLRLSGLLSRKVYRNSRRPNTNSAAALFLYEMGTRVRVDLHGLWQDKPLDHPSNGSPVNFSQMACSTTFLATAAKS